MHAGWQWGSDIAWEGKVQSGQDTEGKNARAAISGKCGTGPPHSPAQQEKEKERVPSTGHAAIGIHEPLRVEVLLHDMLAQPRCDGRL